MGRRRYPRNEINHSANFLFEEQGYSGCQIRNFSKGGLFITWGESGLSTVMVAGFHEPEQRARAVVEINSGQITTAVEIAYVNQSGCGVAFIDANETLYAYLQAYAQDAVDDPVAQQQELPNYPDATQSIIQQLQDKALGFLKKEINQFFMSAKMDLIAATDHMNSSGEQGDLFFAVRTLETEEQEISNHFFASVEAGFNALVNGEPQAREQTSEDEQGSELELIDKEDFDEWIFLEGIAHKVESQLAKQIYEVNFALSHLFQRPVKLESNPLSPIALLLQMKDVLGEYAVTPMAKKILYETFSRCYIHQYP